jgi:hypothetical protein
MITFKLENNAAEAMLSILNASNPHATFVEELNTQFFEQTVVDVIEAPVVEAAPKTKVKTKSATPDGDE